MEHFCHDACPLSCNGRKAKAAVHVEAALLLLAGGPIPLCLLYRWKGFDRASAFAWRGRKCRDVYRRAWELAFPKAAIRKAEAEAAAAGGGEPSYAVKATIRASACIKWMQEDAGAERLGAAVILNQPLQACLNAAFAAETATTTVADMCARAVGSPPPEGWAQAEGDAIRKNFQVLTGARGAEVVQRFSNLLLNYESQIWQDAQLSEDTRFVAASACVNAMADAWLRLVFISTSPGSKSCASLACSTSIMRMCGPLHGRSRSSVATASTV